MTMVGVAASSATTTIQLAKDVAATNTGNSVGLIDLINDGTGYTAPPLIRIAKAPSEGLMPLL